MKSLVSIVEGILDTDAGLDTHSIEMTHKIMEICKPFWATWVNKNDHEGTYRTESLYDVSMRESGNIIRGIIRKLQKLKVYDYKDFKQFMKRQAEMTNPDGANLLERGAGVLVIDDNYEVGIHYVMNGADYHYWLRRYQSGHVCIQVIKNPHTIGIADRRGIHGFEIPGEVAEKIFKCNEISK